MSTEDIGKMLGCSSTPILSRLKDAGVYNPKKIKEKRKERYLQEMKNEARKRGGRCLSTTFKTVHHHLEWECSFGHKWKAPPRHVFGYMKSCCGDCGVSYAERMCKIAFESIFKKPFPKCRPDWLKNETGKNLELDGYCQALRLAFDLMASSILKFVHLKVVKLLFQI